MLVAILEYTVCIFVPHGFPLYLDVCVCVFLVQASIDTCLYCYLMYTVCTIVLDKIIILFFNPSRLNPNKVRIGQTKGS